jgi:hypothetical protein
MATKLHFNSTDEFEGLFKRKSIAVTRSIVQGIEHTMQMNKRSALLFEITFEDADSMYEISLPVSQWTTALESCLSHLHKEGSADEQIDCWKLLEAAKNW